MYPEERYAKMMEMIRTRQSVSVHYLAKALYVSEPTVRRDLKVLEEQGRIKRTHGGAVLDEMIHNEVPLSLRERSQIEEKLQIAASVLPYLHDGQSIFLDASSTVAHVIPYLERFSELTVITNSPKASLRLAERKIRCLCTGGLLLENSIAYVGNHAQDFIRHFNVDLFLFSCRGLSERGKLTDSSLEESLVRQVMLEHARKKICLCTSEKIGKEYLYTLTDVTKIDAVLTAVPLPAGCLAERSAE